MYCHRSVSRELLLTPIVIHRSDHEYVMIEAAANSVRMSIKVKQIDEMDAILVTKFSRFLMQRADNFVVLRRRPIFVSVPHFFRSLISLATHMTPLVFHPTGLRRQLFTHELQPRGYVEAQAN